MVVQHNSNFRSNSILFVIHVVTVCAMVTIVTTSIVLVLGDVAFLI